MSSSKKYILYLALLHLAIAGLAYRAFAEQPLLILAVEALSLCSGYVAFRIYHSIIAPVKLLGQGAAALEDQDFSVKLLPTGSREMDGIVRVYNNMIDQLRAERVGGKQREEFLDRLLDSARLGVAILDFDGNVTSMNAWMQAKCRTEGFRASVLQHALHPRQRPDVVDAGPGQHVFPGPGGRRYHVDRSSFIDRGFERGYLVVQDVTAELLTAEKEAYGKVIRMMAHEVNNTNAAVVSILQVLLEAAAENDGALPEITRDYLPAAIQRAENMTLFIHNFARVVRLPPARRAPTDLNLLLRATGGVISAALAESDISLDYQLSPKEPTADLDGPQIEQVIINALTNALQSIGQGGRVVISSTADPAGFVIADDGPGISAEDAPHLFTPFFSTKVTGQGIGLTLTREILENHGAYYQLSTEADGWTRLRVHFPPAGSLPDGRTRPK